MDYNIIKLYVNESMVNIATADNIQVDVPLHHNLQVNNVINLTSQPPEARRSCVATLFLAIALGAIVILTIVGNALVIVSIIVNANLRTTTYYFIANLALADLLLGTTVLPFSATLEVLQFWLFGQLFCDIWAAIDVLCCTASILSLCVISIDRYIGVTRPLQRGHIMGQARTVYVIIFIWLLSMAISVAPLIGWKEEPNPNHLVCTVTTQPGYVLFSVSGSFYIPCLIILVVYYRIYRETVKYTRCLTSGAKLSRVDEDTVVSLRIHMGKNTSTDLQNERYQIINKIGLMANYKSGSSQCTAKKHKHNSRTTFLNKVAKFNREKKAAKTLGVVVGVFIICWLPFFIILPVDSLCTDCSLPPLVFKMCFWLGYVNSTANPLIYTCSSMEFRRAFLNILCCRRFNKHSRRSRTEFQMRTADHYGYRRRAIRQKQQTKMENDPQISLPEISTSSSSTPRASHVVNKNVTSKVSLPQTLLNIGSVGAGSISLEILGNGNALNSLFSNCKEISSHTYHNGVSQLTVRRDSLEQAFSGVNKDFCQNRLHRHQSWNGVNGRNDFLRTPDTVVDKTPGLDDPHDVGLREFSYNLWDGDSCPDTSHISKLHVTDFNGSGDVSCYSLAETVSCSD